MAPETHLAPTANRVVPPSDAAEPLSASLFGPKQHRASDDLVKTRRMIGYGLGILSIAGLASFLCLALYELHSLVTPSTELEFRGQLLRLGAHAVVAATGVFFFFQLLRAAERMLIPWWWFTENPDAAKSMLGISEPIRQVRALAAQLIKGFEAASSRTDRPR